MIGPEKVPLISSSEKCRERILIVTKLSWVAELTMTATGERIDEIGTLVQAGGLTFFRRDNGGRYQLELHCLPVNLIKKRVRLVGTLVGPMLVHAGGITSA